MLEVIFPKSLMGATMQDGGKKEKMDATDYSNFYILHS